MRVTGVIPARLESSRLPGKMLLNETGKPLIQHTWESASQAGVLRDSESGQPRLLIATDSLKIADCAGAFGASVAMTGHHSCGSDRIAEIVRRGDIDTDIIVNIQGDEPEIDPDAIDRVASLLIADPSAGMATLCTPITDLEMLNDPGNVKAVCGANGQALYFSRSPVPFCRDGNVEELLISGQSPFKLHLGIYAYRKQFLLEMTSRPASPLEQLEKLEQLRALEMGAIILIDEVAHRSVGIDTPADYARFVARRRAA